MYKKKLNAYLVKFDDKFMITDTKIVFEVNETGARIFDLCNGKNTVEDMAKKISSKYSYDYEDVLTDCRDFVVNLEKLGLLFK